jgi:hypothetical protein
MADSVALCRSQPDRSGGGGGFVGHRGEVVYGRSRSAAHTREIAEWVANRYQATVIGESTVYRLT